MSDAPPPVPVLHVAPPPPPGWEYADFTTRSLAFAIDQVLLIGIIIVLMIPAGLLLGLMQMYTWPFSALVVVPSMQFSTILVAWLYFALPECSKHQGSFGKRMCGLVVTDLEGRRLTLLRSTGRFFAKFVSAAIMMVGFIMAGFTERHQALHDMLAETLVLKKIKA